MAQKHLGRKHNAICSFNKALAIDSTSISASLNLGYIYLDDKSYIRAIRHFEKVLEAEPTNTEALIALGRSWGCVKKTSSGWFK